MVYQLGWTLVQSLWEGSIIAAIAALVLMWIPRRAAQVRYVCHCVAMVSVLTVLAVTLLKSPPPPSPVPTASVSAAPVYFTSTPPTLSDLPAMPVDVSRQMSQPPSPRVTIDAWIGEVALPVGRLWFVGVILLGLWRLTAWISVQRLRVVQNEPADSGMLQTANRLAERLKLSRGFEILVSHFTDTPMVIGWLRPVILIPASALTGLSPLQLEGILAHELAHIRRHDYLVNLLQIVAETLLFYHPAIWWISGTYKLSSHDRATLAGSVTAAEAKDGIGPWNASQQLSISRGTGTFTVLLPISIRGWPHVSFYQGNSFGEVYIGTGDWVLKP